MKRDPRCKFAIQEEQEMISLYNDGLCLTQIGNKFNVYSSTIWRILNRNGINLRSHGEGTRLLHQHMEIEPPQDFPWHLHDKFSKLLAIFLLTDGYMKSGGGIMLICTDKILQNYFLTLIKETYGLAPTVGSYMKKGKETVVHSKLVASCLFELSPTYKTSPRDCSLPEYFQGLQPSLSFLSNEGELLNEVIRIAMSTDGTVNVEFPRNMIYPKLEFGCAHPSLLKEWQTIFDSVGIKSYILRSNITWSKIKGLGIKELKSIKRFIQLGGFIEGVKITGKSRYYASITKNCLLNLIFEMNENSFQFPKGLGCKEKNVIVRDMITNPLKRKKWWKIGIEYPKVKRMLEKEKIRQDILNFVKQEVENDRLPTYLQIKDKFKINIQHRFKGGLHEIYRCAGVKNRREAMKERILEFVIKSTEDNYFPTGEEIDRTLHTNFRQYFISIVDVYNKAGVSHPRIVKRQQKKAFKTKYEGREAIKKYLLQQRKNGVYPSQSHIENVVRVKLSSYFQGIHDAYEYSNIIRYP